MSSHLLGIGVPDKMNRRVAEGAKLIILSAIFPDCLCKNAFIFFML